jgi:hypothetical protein
MVENDLTMPKFSRRKGKIMSAITTAAKQRRNTRAKPYNKKQAINAFVKKFKHDFDMKDDSIDLREMAKNFNDGPIPVEDIHQAIVTVLGPQYHNITFGYDPSGGNYLGYASGKRPKEYFDYIDWKDLYLWTIFQRDVAPNHVEKIYKDFDESSVIVPCIIKITLLDGKVIYCVWDGHHTVQVCRLKGYTKFQAWIIDLDQFTTAEIEEAGFGDTDEERIKFGCFIAGTNMRRINGLNKRPLAPYDDFMIGLETRDPKFTAMNNILAQYGCMPRRHATCDGAWTQIKSGIECFELEGKSGPSDGAFWSRAIAFQRNHWKQGHLVLELYRPMSYLYAWASVQGFSLPASFDKELAKMLSSEFGDAEEVQEGLKESYWDAVNNNLVIGEQPQHDKFRVLNGIINFYKQSGGKVMLPAPTIQWKVVK